VGEVAGELEALGDKPVTPGQGHRGRQPPPLSLLVRDNEQDVRAATFPFSFLDVTGVGVDHVTAFLPGLPGRHPGR
jgi:hypothetical protein